MLYCICSVTHLRVSMWYLILLVALSDSIRGTDILFLFKCGFAFKAGLGHLSWNNSGGSTIVPAVQLAKSHARSPRALSRGETSVLVLDFPYSRLTIANLASPPRRAPCGVWSTQPRPMPGCWPIALPYPR